VLGFLSSPGLAIIVRGATQVVRREQYVDAAKVSGLNSRQLIARHVLPRIMSTIIVQASLFAGVALIFQTGLGFLGLGIEPPTASWGAMVAEGSRYISLDPWMIIPPGLVITLTIVALSLVGDSLRDSRADSKSSRRAQTNRRGRTQPSTLVEGPMTMASRRKQREEDLNVHDAHVMSHVDPPNAESLLSVRGLSLSLQGGRDRSSSLLISDVSFELEAGRTVGIVGESGSGKTLTALAITGLLPPNVTVAEGDCFFDDTSIKNMDRHALYVLRGGSIGVISQDPVSSLDPSFSVGSQIAEVVRNHRGLNRRAARIEAIRLLDVVKLPDATTTYKKFPHELSGGMAQRVAIALALAGQPRLLIADEPTTALDPTVQLGILDLLRTLQHEWQLAVILISHDWGVIADFCDSVIVMYSGQIVESAIVFDVFDEPRHPYTRALIQSNPHYSQQPRTMLPAIGGTVLPPGQWPIGCHFADRCEFKQDDCVIAPIPEIVVGDHHLSRCLHSDALLSIEVKVRQSHNE